jgi:penicillin amidase
MIVSPGAGGFAYGIYPGGQSGNPGSRYYDNFIADWSKGKYYRLKMLPNSDREKRMLCLLKAYGK